MRVPCRRELTSRAALGLGLWILAGPAWAQVQNLPPQVSAGPNLVISGPTAGVIGSVSDDAELPLSTQWSQSSGPGPAIFSDPTALATSVTLPGWGTYVLRLSADDGTHTSWDEVAISVVAAPTDLRAFPEAEGFGAYAVGGRGGQVLAVTTLADSGPGSLRAAIDAEGPRTVVFRVSGIIWLNSGLIVRNPYLTIAGHTAPGSAGITLANHTSTDTVLLVETHDVVLRHLRVRPGPGGDPDGISIEEGGAYNIIIDHCSVQWGVDENIATYRDAHHLTIQWSIVAEALDCSSHPKGCHSKGMLLGSEGGHSISVHHNLFAHNAERNPRVSADGVVDVVNNVIYNPEFTGSWGPSHVSGVASILANYIGNSYIPGVDSGSADWMVSAGPVQNAIYLEDNQVPGYAIRPADQGHVVPNSHPAVAVTIAAAQLAREKVLRLAGASHGLTCGGTLYPRRDDVDARIVSDVIHGTGGRIDRPADVGGHPATIPGAPCPDADLDGMPDMWEAELGLDPQDPTDAASDPDGDGYTLLENYLTGVASVDVPSLSGAGRAGLRILLLAAGLMALRRCAALRTASDAGPRRAAP